MARCDKTSRRKYFGILSASKNKRKKREEKTKEGKGKDRKKLFE